MNGIRKCLPNESVEWIERAMSICIVVWLAGWLRKRRTQAAGDCGSNPGDESQGHFR